MPKRFWGRINSRWTMPIAGRPIPTESSAARGVLLTCKKLDCLGSEIPDPPIPTLLQPHLAQLGKIGRSAKQPGMAGDAPHHGGTLIMDRADQECFPKELIIFRRGQAVHRKPDQWPVTGGVGAQRFIKILKKEILHRLISKFLDQ